MALTTPVVGFLYEVIRSSWMVASVIMKFFVAGVLLRTLQINGVSREYFEERVQQYGRYAVLLIGLTGILVTLGGFTFQPNFLFVSEVIAVSTLGYLFWKY